MNRITLPPRTAPRRHKPYRTFVQDNRAEFAGKLFQHRHCRANLSTNMTEPTTNAKFIP